MNERLAIAIINHKGGVGKTTLSTILTEIALFHSIKDITAIDLDSQRNFTSALRLLDKSKDEELRLKVTDHIEDVGSVMIIDCPPVIDGPNSAAIEFADIILVPIMPDCFSLINLSNVYKLGEEHGKSKEQMPLVCVGFNSSGSNLLDVVSTQLQKRDYYIAANTPIHKNIPFNLISGRPWDSGLQLAHRKVFYRLWEDIQKAYQSMLQGGDHGKLWKGGLIKNAEPKKTRGRKA